MRNAVWFCSRHQPKPMPRFWLGVLNGLAVAALLYGALAAWCWPW